MSELRLDFIFILNSLDCEKRISETSPSEVLKEAILYEGKPCCSIKGGFEISINGKVWNSFDGNLMYDDLYVAFNLVKALTSILKGGKKYVFWMYEESNSTMELVDENMISIVDKAFGKVIFEKRVFDLKNLSLKVLETAKTLNSFIEKIIININQESKKESDLKDHLLSIKSKELVMDLEKGIKHAH